MSTNDQNRYDVSGLYASAKASPAPTKLPAPTSRPNGAQEPRRAVVLSIPTPALDRGRIGRRELRGFVDRLGQGCEVAGAIARFNGAQENLEKSTQSLEQTFATGGAGCARSRTGSPTRGRACPSSTPTTLPSFGRG